MTMMCPIQTPSDTKNGEWLWYRYDGTMKNEIIANNSVADPNVTSLKQSRDTRITSQDVTLTLGGLQLNDTGVYECQLKAGNRIKLGYIKVTVMTNGMNFITDNS